jgi:hypothetical protein
VNIKNIITKSISREQVLKSMLRTQNLKIVSNSKKSLVKINSLYVETVPLKLNKTNTKESLITVIARPFPWEIAGKQHPPPPTHPQLSSQTNS